MTREQLLALIPQGKEYDLLRFTLDRIASDFADKLGDFSQARVQGWLDEIASGDGRSVEQIRSDIFQHIITPDAIKQKYGVDDQTVQALIAGQMTFADLGKGATGQLGTPGGVLAGGQTISVKTANGETRYYQVYEFPPGSGQWVAYQYNNREQAEAALGKDFSVTARSDTWFKQNVLAEAAAEEVVGLKGSFQGLVDEVMRDAAARAGLRDPSVVGQIANDPEMQRIMAMATIGNWSPEQILAEQRNTNFWKNTLYPGIEHFYGKTASPEQAWANYVGNVTPALKQLGYQPDANGSFDAQIKQMLDSGIDDQAFLSQAPVFAQAQQNSDFANVLNQWAQRDLGREIGFNDWFDLLAGESIPELEQLAERASLAYMAQEASAGITDLQVENLAERTDLSQAEAARLFSDFNQAILSLGESGLRRGGLTRDEVLSAAAGLNPETGRSVEEVRLAVAKLAKEEDLFDEEKISWYVGFGRQGTPERPGISMLAPERG